MNMSQRVSLMVGCLIVGIAVAGAGPAVAGDTGDSRGLIGPDVVVFDLIDTDYYGSSGGISAYSVGTESCNRGDVPVEWVSSTNQHPVIAQNLYRYKDGRLEQLGQSWLKHGFLSVNGSACDTCIQPPNGGAQLGVGCSDPYWASLNGDQTRLGPRSEVNAFTGVFVMPHSVPSGDALLKGRIQVPDTDVTPADNVGARYFVEGQYVTPDDAGAGNGLNNASYREVQLESDKSLTPIGSTTESTPAIMAWADLDATVTARRVDVPGEGSFFIAYKASDNGNGTWRYEYALFNLDSDRSARSFAVPIEASTVVSNVGFHDVNSHSGEPYDLTDWAVTVDPGGGWVTWSTDDYATNVNANALRWGTMYNFWFDADSPPVSGSAQIGLFRPGTPSSLNEGTIAPGAGASLIFTDGFEDGTLDAWQVSVP